MNYNITAFSTALFSTWINVESLNLLIDAGDGVTAGLLQKSRKIKNVFVTHPDRDHLHGLPQLLQLNARPSFPKIHYPKDSGSFPAMENFLGKFDPHVMESEWIPIVHKDSIEIKKNIIVESLRNEHVPCPVGVHKSLSYKVFEVKHKLKPEFQSKSPKQIKEIVLSKGRAFVTEPKKTNILSFSGDTPVDDYSKWEGSETLMHEATFLHKEEDIQTESRGNKHSTLDEVLRMVAEIDTKRLILHHFSSRYSEEDIRKAVLKGTQEYNIKIPVFAVFPGEIKIDILNGTPINA
ncbi:MAG: MBL fold metallo-hydrolase [Bacteroidota bacterium]